MLLGFAIALAAGGTPAAAFSLFGIYLWGQRSDDNGFEVIDPLHYQVTLHVSGGDGGLQGRLESASSLWTDRDSPASGSTGLLSKARGDYRRLLAALYGAGYYGPTISIRAGGQEVADLMPGVDFPQQVKVSVEVVAGPPFLFGRTEIVNAPPPPEDPRAATPESVGFVTGKPALSGVINQASAISVERWRQLAHAKAAEADRDVVANHPASQLDVKLLLDPGRAAHYGPLTVTGSQRVDPGFTAFMANLPEGRPFDPDDIQTAQDRLNRLGVFSQVRFVEAPEILPDGSLPMTLAVQDRKPRTIGFGGTLSTIDGAGIQAYWLHRNLWGHAESLRFDASIDGLGASLNPDDYDYSVGVTLTKPGVYTPDTNFITSLIGQRNDFDTYREQSVTATAGFSQLFGKRTTGEIYASASRARYEDGFGVRHFTLVSLIGRGSYDRRDNPLDATRGYFLSAEAIPFYDFSYDNAAIRGSVEGRVYKGFGPQDKIVLAGLARVGSFVGPSVEESPPDMLFFAGGGGSIRGYAYKSIGVESIPVPGEEPFVVGGKGLILGSGELRYRINPNWGAVGFVDSGIVTADSDWSGESDWRTGVGLGVRYYTSIGILRGDLATPVNPRSGDSRIALYIGIGQAF
ncbi:MAG: autotransporter assembly complex family protein [Amaricoccus sp.]